MSKLEGTIEQVRADLVPLEVSRDVYLAQCAAAKIQERSRMYDEQFSKYLSLIESTELYQEDFSRIARSLESLSSLILRSYDSLITMIQKCDKNLFK